MPDGNKPPTCRTDELAPDRQFGSLPKYLFCCYEALARELVGKRQARSGLRPKLQSCLLAADSQDVSPVLSLKLVRGTAGFRNHDLMVAAAGSFKNREVTIAVEQAIQSSVLKRVIAGF
jgi:hypothetical protein